MIEIDTIMQLPID